MKYGHQSRQRGLALIMAVLIAALAVTAIAFAAWRQQVRLRSVEVRTDSAQAQLLLRASITIARTALIDDLRQDTRNGGLASDDPTEELFTHREDTDVEKGHASGFIEDASGRFNLNELRDGQGGIDTKWFDAYQRLLAQLSLDPELAFTLADWLDDLDQPLPNGAEDMYYLAQDPPRRTANGVLTELSELLQIKGYTPQVIAKLKPFVDVFPMDMPAGGTNNGSININFCSPELLSATMGVLDKSEAIALLREVRQQPYQNFSDFYARLPKDIQNRIVAVNGLQGNLQNQLTAQSRFFYANLKLDYGRVHWSERVLLRRNDPHSTPRSVEVVRRLRLAE